ncbi:MAG: hypothetical protein AB7C97_00545 [Oscillospiraceae bacterium]
MILFNKTIEPCCSYCRHGTKLCDTDVACLKRGVVGAGESCEKFTYDPLKRTPPAKAQLKTSLLSEKDFAL